jgi:large subunit ribosomal protein L30
MTGAAKASPAKKSRAEKSTAEKSTAEKSMAKKSAPRKKAGDTATVKVTQVRSAIGTKPKHRGTLRALGLGRIGKTNVLPDRPDTRGMIARVPHLIRVEEGK